MGAYVRDVQPLGTLNDHTVGGGVGVEPDQKYDIRMMTTSIMRGVILRHKESRYH